MCGRYTLRDPKKVHQMILAMGAGAGVALPRRFNTAPTQSMPVVRGSAGGPELCEMRWGFVPFFARKDPKPIQMINARSETAAEKPTFRQGVQKRRCAIPADGFFEWRRDADKTKTPFYIRRRGEEPFLIAGVYEEESAPFPAGFVLLTTGPNELMVPIHDRMPVILTPEKARVWLHPGPITPEQVHELCRSYPATDMIAEPVSSIVNNARNDVAECVVPVTTAG